jgi:hypothetical protein
MLFRTTPNNNKDEMIQKVLLIILTVLTFQSCNLGTSGTPGISGTWKNDNIDRNKREEIKILNDKLFKAIISNDVAGVKALLSDKLLEKVANDLDKLINEVSGSFKSNSYRILDEYNVYNTKTDIDNTLPSGITNDNDYVIKYLALNKEMYVSLLLPNELNNELLITAIYGNYDNHWKINILLFGQYSLFKKTAPDYYQLAKISYDKSYLIDAVNYIGLSKQCLSPANTIFQYQKEKDINEFHEKVMKEANSKFKFPMTLDNIKTKPKVFKIFPKMINEGFFPMVYYLSDISLKDTIALKAENDKVKNEVNRLFKGINKDKKYVFYWAFKEIPDGKKSVEHYGFIDKSTE